VVLEDVTLDIAPGEFVALIGRSGSGKSTLLRAIAGLDDGVQGSGHITAPDSRSVLFQDSRLLPWETVLQNVILGLRLPDAAARGRAVLASVGLAGHEEAWPNTLSGGEQQRTALARSLVREPELLLADEPFGALDALTRIRMHELLFRLVEQHRPTVLLVTHDVDEALILADRVLVMEEGRIITDARVPLSAVIGSTEAEAQRLWRELNELSDPSVGLARLSSRFGGHDFSHLDLDAPLSVSDFPDPATVQAAQSRAQVITSLVARERPTLRALLHSLAGARGHFTLAGTPEQVADVIEDWFRCRAADGFNIMPPILPALFDVFVAEVVPILQKRGLFRTDYAGATLRSHYGLARPANQFFDPAPALQAIA